MTRQLKQMHHSTGEELAITQTQTYTDSRLTALFPEYPGEPVPER